MNQLDEKTPGKKLPFDEKSKESTAMLNTKSKVSSLSRIGTPNNKNSQIEMEEINKQEISKQLEEIEKQHTGLKDLQSMSEITAISKIRPIKPKEYQNQQNIIDEQTNESIN